MSFLPDAIDDLLNRRAEQAFGKTTDAVLGDLNGVVYDGRTGYMRVRFPLGESYSEALAVRVRGTFPVYAGSPVRVGIDDEGELAILGTSFSGLVQNGLNPVSFNFADPSNKFIYTMQIADFGSYAVSTGNTPTLNVAVNTFIYIDTDRQIQRFPGTQVNLASYIPGTQQQRLATLLMSETGTLAIKASSPISTAGTLTIYDHVQECLDQVDNLHYPVKAWRLADAQTVITDESDWLDLRQFINPPVNFGFPNPITGTIRIKAGWQQLSVGRINNGDLIIDGELITL